VRVFLFLLFAHIMFFVFVKLKIILDFDLKSLENELFEGFHPRYIGNKMLWIFPQRTLEYEVFVGFC